MSKHEENGPACEYANRLSAYYDGELGADVRRDFDSHLERCAHCRGELEKMAVISKKMKAVQTAELDEVARARIQRAMLKAGRPHLLRFAGWLNAAAAVLLITGIAILRTTDSTVSVDLTEASYWEISAVSQDSEYLDLDPWDGEDFFEDIVYE